VLPPCDVLGRLESDDVQAVHALVRSVEAADGTPPLSEHVLLHLPYGGDAEVRNLLARDDSGTVVAYAHLDVTDEVEGSSAELAVAPAAFPTAWSSGPSSPAWTNRPGPS
jgi:mycothiol synthase